jgi:16S rRNA (cytidine1402-2'-O)-methyltransferase
MQDQEQQDSKLANKSRSAMLYVVATPIGNLQDLSLRAIEILKSVDVILAEDTRHSRRLLNHYQIQKPILALHEHNERAKIETLIRLLETGQSLALISDAGTPLISDPGFHLLRAVQQEGYIISPIPGASAVIAALSVSGLPSDRFCFEGFLPSKTQARQRHLQNLIQEPRTLIFYEAPHRLLSSLQDMMTLFGGEREAVLARELTKSFETIRRDNLAALVQWVKDDPNQTLGEMVLLVRGYEDEKGTEYVTEGAGETVATQRILKVLLQELPMAQAASLAAKITGVSKRILYDQALRLK